MITDRLIELAEKRATLVARIEHQRTDLSRRTRPIKLALELADGGISTLRQLKQQPAVLVALVVALLVAKPRRVIAWARRGWFAWRLWSGIKRRLQIG